MTIPNHLAVVAQLAEQFPEDWRQAHTGGPGTERFIRRLAWRLHGIDRRFGLNGKRGNPQDISDDAICFDGTSQLGDVDPTRGNAPVTVLDVIGGAGGPNPVPAWGAVGPATPQPHAAWVQPQPVDDSRPVDPPPPPPNPPTGCACACDTAALEESIAALSALVGSLTDELLEQRKTQAEALDAVRQARALAQNVSDRLAAGLSVEASVRLNGRLQGRVRG